LHKNFAAQEARIRIKSTETSRSALLEFFHEERTLRIDYEHTFPFRILGWEDKLNGELLSKATLLKSIKSPYWRRNSNNFSALRDTLELNE